MVRLPSSMRGNTAVFALALAACAHSDPGGGGDDDTTDAAVGDGAPDDGTAIDARVDAPGDGSADAMPTAAMWRDDSAAEFGAGTVSNAFVEAYGAISPAAYYTGGLLWRGANADSMGAGPAATWTQVNGFAQTGRSAITLSTAQNFFAETPPSVGLTDADTFTMLYEGEILLDAGTTTFEMLADDHGFVEIAPAPGGAFARVTSCDWPTAASGTFVAPATGWYPIRYAASEDTGEFLVQLRAMGPGLPSLAPIPRHRLRARVSGVTGMFMSGFDDGHLLGDVDHTIDQVTPTNTNWNAGNPGDLGMTAADDFSVRWSGQFRVDVGGTYQFRYVTDDGQRLWVNNQKVLDAWDDTTHDQTAGGLALAPGWHDLVVEQTERGGGAIASLSIATGPELTGQTLPLDRLRPVEGRGERFESAVDRTDRAIADLGQTDAAVVIAAPAGATVTAVDVSYSFTHTYWGDLEIRLIAPDGTAVLLRDNVGGASTGTELQRLFRLDLNGRPVNGTWILRVNDTQSTDVGTLLDFQVTPHHAAGEPPIAATSAYDSAVRDLGAGVNAITRVSWIERLPAGADIGVRLRTCDVAGDCAAQPWSAAITDAAGGVPAVTPRRFAQYRIELTSNGDRPPALDQITVEYNLNP